MVQNSWLLKWFLTQFEIFIYTQIIPHDVHNRFEVVIGDVIYKLLDDKESTRLWYMPIASGQEKVFCISLLNVLKVAFSLIRGIWPFRINITI